MSRQSARDRALAQVIAEARRAAPPELPWDRLEARLLERVGQRSAAPVAALPEPKRWRWVVLGVPVVAAAAALTLLLAREVPEVPGAPPSAPEPAAVSLALDGDQLTPLEPIVAADTPVEVAHSGRARWWLDTGSSAAVVEHEGVIRVRLLRGALSAKVVPASEPERFVVEAANVRVAVHGTAFRVELDRERARVNVSQGVVVVTALDQPNGVATRLVAPAQREFDLDGSAWLAPSAPPPATHATPVPRAAAPSSAAQAELVPEQLSIGEIETGVASVVSAVTRCFEAHTPRSSDLRVTARTSVTLDVAPSGAIAGSRFSPPLAPAVAECAKPELEQIAFAQSEKGARVTRVLELR